MSQYTLLNLQEVVQICKQYGIQKVHSFSILSGGSENTNYLVHTKDTKFVLTICEQKTMKSAGQLGQLLEHLAQHNFETSKLVRTSEGGVVSIWNDKPILLKLFLEGEIIEDLSIPILERIGIELGKLHQIEPPAYLPKTLSYGLEYFYRVKEYAEGSTFEKWLQLMTAYFEPFITEDLPKSLIHGDLFFSNIIVGNTPKQAHIMDFEEASYYYRVFDIGMSIIGLCCQGAVFDMTKAQALLKGYRHEIELRDQEKKALQAFTVYAATSMTFWRHRNFNHVNSDPEMHDHYLGLKKVADSIRRIPTLDFSKILT